MSIEYTPMYCPICNGFYFSELQEEDNSDDFQCLKCGWKYNLYQIEKPDEPDEKNGKSLNEYRRWYENKIAENPEFNYLDETILPPVPHSCPVCGKFQFKDEDSYEICPICGWEDDSSETEPNQVGANGVSFLEYCKLYQQKLKDNTDYRWKSEL